MERGNYERNPAEIRKETPRGNNERTPNYFFFDLYSFQMWPACLNTCSDSRLSSEKLFRCFKWKCFFGRTQNRKGEDPFRASKWSWTKIWQFLLAIFSLFKYSSPPSLPPNCHPIFLHCETFLLPQSPSSIPPSTQQPILLEHHWISMFLLFRQKDPEKICSCRFQTLNIQFPFWYFPLLRLFLYIIMPWGPSTA